MLSYLALIIFGRIFHFLHVDEFYDVARNWRSNMTLC